MKKVQIKISPTTIIEADGNSQVEVWDNLASLSEVFGEAKCGLCSGPVIFTTRQARDYTFREVKCTDQKCGAALNLFARDDGGLWIVRTNKDKTPKGKNGWTIYRKENQSDGTHGHEANYDDQRHGDEVPF